MAYTKDHRRSSLERPKSCFRGDMGIKRTTAPFSHRSEMQQQSGLWQENLPILKTTTITEIFKSRTRPCTFRGGHSKDADRVVDSHQAIARK
jgi:hypothetical protein